MDHQPHQPHSEHSWQNPLDASGQPGVPPQPDHGQSPWGASPYPQYGAPEGGQPYPQYGPPSGEPQYPPYGPPAGAQPPFYPYPEYSQAQPPKKSSKVWLWVLLSVIGLSVLACVGSCIFFSTAIGPLINSSLKNQEATASAIAAPDNSDSFSAENTQTVSIGQAVKIHDVSCTLNLVTTNAGDSSVTPRAGDEFMIVKIKLTNHSKQSQRYSSFNFYVVNSSGTASLNTNVAPKAYKQQLPEGVLAPGQSVEGKLVFEVLRSDHSQTFDWQPDLNASPQDAQLGSWSLGL